ncbi:MAG TPA: T9SS type A sorting domain-containing protein, partial [Algoriphagus sp.]|nr:T9SS type A sorting domain-containing protein [Algoriphagus sp.]
WFGNTSIASSISFRDSKGNLLVTAEVQGKEMTDLYYTSVEKAETISGLEGQSWIGADKYYRYDYAFRVPFNEFITYEVTLGGHKFSQVFKSAPDAKNWENIRFIALSDSETEPRGRVTHRTWFPGLPLFRPFTLPNTWKQKFGSTIEQGIELPNYFLTEKEGYAANLEIVNSRKPDFMMMPGDLVQGGGYMPAWDEFWRHNSGQFGTGLSSYAIIAAIGNWESTGEINGGYGINERGKFNPVVGRSRFHSFFEFDINDPLQKHRQSYYRTDYGPITILTLDSSNGTPEEKRTDTPDTQKLKNKEFSDPGTDTQENYTQAQYNAAGGNDLSGFGPGTAQYIWLEANLKEARESKRLIFVQFHHIPFSSGENGVPMNHELSTGQGGTPLRVLHPLFEEYGVIAVLAGHDELFERSFVDENKDGKGVQYYDVGVAGDGLYGVKRNWISNPLATLDYNQFSQWTADQKSIEQWNTSGANPVLTDGGKHYGHLEVNLKKVKDGAKTFAQIDFEPVYIFPVMDQNYNLQRIERRVYNDKLRIMVELEEEVTKPVFKNEITVELDENGKAITILKDYLENEPLEEWKAEFSRSPEYSCVDLEGAENEIKITDSKGNSWIKVVLVKVIDKIAPDFEATDANLPFDKTIGKVLLDAGSFYIRTEFITENCLNPLGVQVDLSIKEITCADFNPDGSYEPKSVTITITDRSGNATSKVRKVNLNVFESKKISISPESGTQLPVGKPAEIRLGEEFEFTLLGWYRNGQLIIGEKGKAILTDQPGTYWARLVPVGTGCVVESRQTEISFTSLPFGQIKESVDLILGPDGKADLKPQDVFVYWPQPDPNLTITLNKSLFNCENLGENEVGITIKNQSGETWEKKTLVIVKDQTKPVLVPKNISLELDVTKGVVEISPESVLAEFGDNCGIKSLTINKNRFTCEDLGKEFSVAIRAEDTSGNVSEAVAIVSVVRSEAEKVIITGKKEICAGEKSVLELSSSKSFEVIRWRRNGAEIQGQTGKTLEVAEPGKYHAVIRYSGACLSETSEFEVVVHPSPAGEIAVDGNILRAPEGNYSYQWFRNGDAIEKATSRTFIAELMGEYSVELTSEAGCKSRLKPVTLTISGIGGKPVNQAIELKIYPNPASDRVKLVLPDGVLISKPNISVYSSEGKDVSTAVQIILVNDSEIEILLNRLAKGTYLIWIVGENQKTFFGKLVVVN